MVAIGVACVALALDVQRPLGRYFAKPDTRSQCLVRNHDLRVACVEELQSSFLIEAIVGVLAVGHGYFGFADAERVLSVIAQQPSGGIAVTNAVVHACKVDCCVIAQRVIRGEVLYVLPGRGSADAFVEKDQGKFHELIRLIGYVLSGRHLTDHLALFFNDERAGGEIVLVYQRVAEQLSDSGVRYPVDCIGSEE